MLRIRTALLTQCLLRNQAIVKFFSRQFFVILLILALIPYPFPQLQAAFNDLPNDPLFSPYIENFQLANVIIGDTAGGQPTGNLRPFDLITRSEFTKITTFIRLLEQAEKQNNVTQYQNLDLDSFTLKINEPLLSYYKAKPGGIDFKDVDDKDEECASNPDGCEPWYAQYVNYAATQNLVKGFPDGTFKPSEPILRIHALKLLMASDGEILASLDDRFQGLASESRIEKVNVGKCLDGAEEIILKNNGGEGLNAHNLVSYVLLADKLDFFGSQCEFFVRSGADTPEKRAAILQKPITRQEIARYFALTTTYSALKIDHAHDPTTSTKEENGMNYFDQKAKETMMEKAEEKKEMLPEKDKEKTEEEKKAEEKQRELMKDNKEKAKLTIKELASNSKEGRCCTSMELSSSCKKIQYKDYKISESSSYNYDRYEGGAWHKATKNGSQCWVPLEDILGGFEEKTNVKPSQFACGLTITQRHLIDQYRPQAYPLIVREIWTTKNSNELSMFMQIGLDLAMRKSKELNTLLSQEKANCKQFNLKLEELHSGHIAASLRHIPVSDPKIKEVEKILMNK